MRCTGKFAFVSLRCTTAIFPVNLGVRRQEAHYMTPYEQIDALQVMASRRVLTWMSRLALTLAVGLATGGILTLHPAFFRLLLLAVTIAYASAITTKGSAK